jgi:hypothetical protein
MPPTLAFIRHYDSELSGTGVVDTALKPLLIYLPGIEGLGWLTHSESMAFCVHYGAIFVKVVTRACFGISHVCE